MFFLLLLNKQKFFKWIFLFLLEKNFQLVNASYKKIANPKANIESLKFVHVVFRHGDRSIVFKII